MTGQCIKLRNKAGISVAGILSVILGMAHDVDDGKHA